MDIYQNVPILSNRLHDTNLLPLVQSKITKGGPLIGDSTTLFTVGLNVSMCGCSIKSTFTV